MVYHFFENSFIQLPFQLLTSEMFFLTGMPKRKFFALKLALGITVQIVAGGIWEQALMSVDTLSLFPFVLLYLGYAFLTMIPLLLCFDLGSKEMVFILAGGYATQHMIFTLSRIGMYLLHVEYQTHGDLLHLILTRYVIFPVGALLVYALIIHRKKRNSTLRDCDARIVVLAFVIMVFAIDFSVYWSYPEIYQGTRIGELICPAYSFVCCVLVLFMEYYVIYENGLKREQETMEHIITASAVQQKSSKEAIDIINIKCHDLKHQIKALEKINDDSARNQYLEEIRDAISIYDASYHTGCSALDYVLREKTLLFNEKGVEFCCMVEGEMVSYMNPADVYALMGNALDNALERVMKEKEGERIIGFQIKHCHEMVLIHLENRCSTQVAFENGLPITDKKDKNKHGFGVKSMKYIVEKYRGELIMSVQYGKFNTDILLLAEMKN